MRTNLKKYLPITLPILMFLVFCMDNLCPSILLPLMPKMAFSLHVSRVELKQAISMLLAGIFLSQFVICLYAYSIDSKVVFSFLFTCLIVGGFCSTQATNIYWFWLGEFLQGFGLGAPYPMIQALVKLHLQDKTAKILSYVGAWPTLMFFFSPILGAQFYRDWHKMFWLVVMAGFIMLGLSWFLPKEPRQKMELNKSFKGVLQLLKNPVYVFFLFFRVGSFIPFYAVLAWLPFLVINDLHVDYKTFSYLFIFPTLSMLLGGILAGLFKERHYLALTLVAVIFFLAGSMLIILFFLHLFFVWSIMIACSLVCMAYYLASVHISLGLLDQADKSMISLSMVFPSLAANLIVSLVIFFLAQIRFNDGIVLGCIFVGFALFAVLLFCLMNHRLIAK